MGSRLQRTARFLAATTYGTEDQADQACATVRRVTGGSGIAPDGRPTTPTIHLPTWVHIAEADSFLAAYQRYGAQPMDGPSRTPTSATWPASPSPWAYPTRPARWPGSGTAWTPTDRSYGGTPAAREAARFLLLQPPCPCRTRARAVLGDGRLPAAVVGKVMLRIRRCP